MTRFWVSRSQVRVRVGIKATAERRGFELHECMLVACVQVVEHLSEELQVHRDLLTMQRDDRAREIEDLRRDVEQQRQQLATYEQTITQLRAIIDDIVRHQAPLNNSALHHRATTAPPVLPTGTLATSKKVQKLIVSFSHNRQWIWKASSYKKKRKEIDDFLSWMTEQKVEIRHSQSSKPTPYCC